MKKEKNYDILFMKNRPLDSPITRCELTRASYRVS